jgi:hypothetical protein
MNFALRLAQSTVVAMVKVTMHNMGRSRVLNDFANSHAVAIPIHICAEAEPALVTVFSDPTLDWHVVDQENINWVRATTGNVFNSDCLGSPPGRTFHSACFVQRGAPAAGQEGRSTKFKPMSTGKMEDTWCDLSTALLVEREVRKFVEVLVVAIDK